MEFTILHLFLLFPFALSSSSESVQSVESFERALEGLKSSDTRSMGSDTAGKEHFHPVRGDKGSDVGSLDKKVKGYFQQTNWCSALIQGLTTEKASTVFVTSNSLESVQSVESIELAEASDVKLDYYVHPVGSDDVGSLDKKVSYVFNKQIDYSNTYWSMQMSSVNMLLSPCLESWPIIFQEILRIISGLDLENRNLLQGRNTTQDIKGSFW